MGLLGWGFWSKFDQNLIQQVTKWLAKKIYKFFAKIYKKVAPSLVTFKPSASKKSPKWSKGSRNFFDQKFSRPPKVPKSPKCETRPPKAPKFYPPSSCSCTPYLPPPTSIHLSYKKITLRTSSWVVPKSMTGFVTLFWGFWKLFLGLVLWGIGGLGVTLRLKIGPFLACSFKCKIDTHLLLKIHPISDYKNDQNLTSVRCVLSAQLCSAIIVAQNVAVRGHF